MFSKEPLKESFKTAGRMTAGVAILMTPPAYLPSETNHAPAEPEMGAGFAIFAAGVIACFAVRRYNLVDRQIKDRNNHFKPR